MNPKSILASKTFWVQLIAVASSLYPPVGLWVAANPVGAVAALGAANILVRFVTKGAITIFPGDAGNMDSGGLGGPALKLLLLTCMAAALVGLPSCATTTAPDGTVTRKPDVESITLGQSIAMWAAAVWQSERAAEREAEKAGEVRGTK